MKVDLLRRITMIIILLSLKISFVSSQNNGISDDNSIIKFKYTILESDSRSFRSFFTAKSGDIKFDLIELKNLSSNSTIYGVEVNIKSNEIEKLTSSIAFANVSNLWGISSSATYRNIQNSGYIFLDKNDLEIIINFLNEIIGASGQPQEKFTLYKISIRDQFELGMVYDPDIIDINKWGFVFSSNNSVYRMNYQDGILLIRSLSRFNKFIKENQKD